MVKTLYMELSLLDKLAAAFFFFTLALVQVIPFAVSLVAVGAVVAYFFFILFFRLQTRLKHTLSEQETLLSLLNMSNAILLRWKNDSTSSIYYASQNVYQLIGCTKHDLESKCVSFSYCIYEDDYNRVWSDLQDAIRKKYRSFTHHPYRVVTKDARVKWVLNHTLLLRDANNNIVSFVGYITDITELKNNELRLKHLSQTDQLTKLHNRLYIDDILQNQYYHFLRNSQECSVILVDLDFFKSVNDNYGHIQGDATLVEFAQLLQNSLREGDYLARWGGEEFLVVLPHTTLEDATTLAHKLCSTVEEHSFSVIDRQTASFGVSGFKKGKSIKQTLDASDKALYASKAKGRNCVTKV